MDDQARALMWPFLLGLFDSKSEASSRKKGMDEKLTEYWILKDRWQSCAASRDIGSNKDPAHGALLELIDDQQHRIEKDIVRTDRQVPFYKVRAPSASATAATDAEHGSSLHIQNQIAQYSNCKLLRDILLTYALYRVDIGYVQGMTDIAAPIVATVFESVESLKKENPGFLCLIYGRLLDHQDTEALCFWLLVHFLHRHQTSSSAELVMNFHPDQSGMRTRLILTTYLMRVMADEAYHTLALLDDPPTPRAERERRRISPDDGAAKAGGVGAIGLLWLFKSMLLVLKRDICPLSTDDLAAGADVMPGATTDSSLNYGRVWRLWDSLLAGWSHESMWMDVWLGFAMIMVYVTPKLLASRSQILDQYRAWEEDESEVISSFEDLLALMSKLSGNVDPILIVQEADRQMRRLRQMILADTPVDQEIHSFNEKLRKLTLSQWFEHMYWSVDTPWEHIYDQGHYRKPEQRQPVALIRLSVADALAWLLFPVAK